jgi:hypothetical protein
LVVWLIGLKTKAVALFIKFGRNFGLRIVFGFGFGVALSIAKWGVKA